MKCKHDDPVSFYKNIETELNKRIHSPTNCRNFTLAFGRAFDAHLKQIKIHKRLTTKWLRSRNFPNKDEIAALGQ